MLIDSHAHLDRAEFDKDEIIKNMAKDNLAAIVTVGVDPERSVRTVEIANNNDNIYAVVGYHPDYADEFKPEDLETLRGLLHNNKVVGVGEIGLDYHEDSVDRDKQKQLFISQILLADEFDLPIILHLRDATGDAIDILTKYKEHIKHGGIAHCYSGSLETAKILIKLGLYISFSGRITFKKVDRSILHYLPLDRILVETDAPFLAPEPLRGTLNVPKNVNYTAQRIADELDMGLEKFSEITMANTKRVLYKMK